MKVFSERFDGQGDDRSGNRWWLREGEEEEEVRTAKQVNAW